MAVKQNTICSPKARNTSTQVRWCLVNTLQAQERMWISAVFEIQNVQIGNNLSKKREQINTKKFVWGVITIYY